MIFNVLSGESQSGNCTTRIPPLLAVAIVIPSIQFSPRWTIGALCSIAFGHHASATGRHIQLYSQRGGLPWSDLGISRVGWIADPPLKAARIASAVQGMAASSMVAHLGELGASGGAIFPASRWQRLCWILFPSICPSRYWNVSLSSNRIGILY